MNFISNELHFFFGNEITLWGKKHTALFQTYDWEKSIFFNALVCVFGEINANTWRGGGVHAPPGPNRVKGNKVIISTHIKHKHQRISPGMDAPPRGEEGVLRPAPPRKNDQNRGEVAGQNIGPNLNFLQ